VTAGGQPPLLIALEVEQALSAAVARGWQVAEIVRSAPPAQQGQARGAAAGPQRVVKQAVVGPRRMMLVVAPSIELRRPHAADTRQ